MTAALEVAGVSARGLVRRINEDGASINGQRLCESEPYRTFLPPGRHLLVVADGMGGHARGDLARDLVLRSIESHGGALRSAQDSVEVLRAANRLVFDHAIANADLRAMGATVVGASIEGVTCCWFNVGDSRAYLFNGQLRQLSIDHVPPAIGGRRTHTVTQSLGGTPRLMEIAPSAGVIELRKGDRLLLCSDGLTDVVADAEIKTHLGTASSLLDAVKHLLSACLSAGAPDNVTIVIAALA